MHLRELNCCASHRVIDPIEGKQQATSARSHMLAHDPLLGISAQMEQVMASPSSVSRPATTDVIAPSRFSANNAKVPAAHELLSLRRREIF